ncbi:MAG TPA: MFS transporter [Trueperaceae bacterium]
MERAELERRASAITGALFAVQSLGSAGVIVTLTVAAIVGAQLSGRAALAGLPAGVFQLGAALSALPWSLTTDRVGRRWGLASAVLVGACGAAGCVAAAATASFPLLIVGLVVMGSGQAAFRLSRFTAAEVNPKARRGRAVATVVLGGTVGSVLGPLLVTPSANVMTSVGLGELAGPYLAGALLFAVAALLLIFFLRPEPKLLAQQVDANEDDGSPVAPARSLARLFADSGVRTAILMTIGSYVVMVMVMGMTSLHMHDHAHRLGSISLVIGAHTLGMFALSPLSGRLADEWGRRPTLALGAVGLLLGCLGSIPSVALLPMMASLFILGFGWNLCFVGGSVMLSDHLTLSERARMQGINDLLTGIPAAIASLVSGLVYASAGFGFMSWAGASISLLLLLLLWQGRSVPSTQVAAAD